MIWDAVSRFGLKHPVVMRGIVGTIAMVVFGYIALALVSSQIVEGNRDTCERGNASRLAEFREKEALITGETRKETESEEKGNRSAAQGSLEIIQAYEAKQEALISIAQNSGNATTEKSVTINCITEWPEPLSLPGASN